MTSHSDRDSAHPTLPRDAERETIKPGICYCRNQFERSHCAYHKGGYCHNERLPSIPPREGPLQSTTEQADASRDHPVREALKLERGKSYVNGLRDIVGPMQERAPGVWLDQHGGVYHSDCTQWNHDPSSAGNIKREVNLLTERVIDFITERDPFGDHFSVHDLQTLRRPVPTSVMPDEGKQK